MINTNFNLLSCSTIEYSAEKLRISSSHLETELAPTYEMIDAFANKKMNAFIAKLFDPTSNGHVQKEIVNLFIAIENGNVNRFNKHLEILAKLGPENYSKILVQAYQLTRVALINPGERNADIETIANQLLAALTDKINGSGNVSISSLKASPQLDLSSLDILDLQKSFIEQEPHQPVIGQNLAQISPQTPTTKPPFIDGDKLEQNSSAISLTSKVVRACQAIYLSTWFTDIPVEMGTMCVSKVLQGQIWRLGTSAILHDNIIHLWMNMTALQEFGPIVEKRWGARGFAKIAGCALVAKTAAEILFGNYSQTSLGISGVVFALAGASHLTRSKTGIKIDPNCAGFWAQQIGFALFMNYIGLNINHKAHLSGYMAGMAFSYLSQ